LIPVSFRVNMDTGKIFYSWPKDILGCQARFTTIPSGRISYLL